MKNWIMTLFEPVGTFCYDLIIDIPLDIVRGIYIAIFVLIALWLFRLPVQTDSASKKLIRDLRWFALGILVLQSIIYVVV